MSRSKEGSFQDELIKDIQKRIPGTIVLKNDPAYIQGFPDLTVIAPNGFTAILECKKSNKEKYQPNQEYYLNYCKSELNHYTRTITPENKGEVLDELQCAYISRR